MRPRQHDRYVADGISKCIFSNEIVRISFNISLKFVPKGPINNILALVLIMAWLRLGDKAIVWTLVYWRIYTSLGLNKLIGHFHYSHEFVYRKLDENQYPTAYGKS